jgi:hypothetical protein
MIENCQNCGGTHYGSNRCPFLPEELERNKVLAEDGFLAKTPRTRRTVKYGRNWSRSGDGLRHSPNRKVPEIDVEDLDLPPTTHELIDEMGEDGYESAVTDALRGAQERKDEHT